MKNKKGERGGGGLLLSFEQYYPTERSMRQLSGSGMTQMQRWITTSMRSSGLPLF